MVEEADRRIHPVYPDLETSAVLCMMSMWTAQLCPDAGFLTWRGNYEAAFVRYTVPMLCCTCASSSLGVG